MDVMTSMVKYLFRAYCILVPKLKFRLLFQLPGYNQGNTRYKLVYWQQDCCCDATLNDGPAAPLCTALNVVLFFIFQIHVRFKIQKRNIYAMHVGYTG